MWYILLSRELLLRKLFALSDITHLSVSWVRLQTNMFGFCGDRMHHTVNFPLKMQHIVHNMMLIMIVTINICIYNINYLCIYLHIQEWWDLRELDGWNCLPLSRPISFVHNDMETATSGFSLTTVRKCGALIFFFIFSMIGCWTNNRYAGDIITPWRSYNIRVHIMPIHVTCCLETRYHVPVFCERSRDTEQVTLFDIS